MNDVQAVDTVADTEVMLDDLGLPGGVRALTDSCLVSEGKLLLPAIAPCYCCGSLCVKSVAKLRLYPLRTWSIWLLVADFDYLMIRCEFR